MNRPEHLASPLALPAAADLLRVGADLELSPLVDTATRARLVQLAETLALPTHTACYECRLGSDASRVDLALCVLPPLVNHEAIQTALQHQGIEQASNAEWLRGIALLERWAAPGSDLAKLVPFVWVAFDLEADMTQLPAPCLGLCIDQAFLDGQSTRRDDAALVELADECHHALWGQSLADTAKRAMQVCLAIPEVEVRPRHLSFMLSRRPPTFKLDVRVPKGRLAPLLSAMDWPGSPEAIQRRVGELMPWDGHVQVNFVLAPELTPPLEIEFLTDASEASEASRFAFIERLVEHGVCEPRKAQLMKSLWQSPLVSPSRAVPLGAVLSWYVKVRFSESQMTEAKTYLGLTPRLWAHATHRSREDHTASR